MAYDFLARKAKEARPALKCDAGPTDRVIWATLGRVPGRTARVSSHVSLRETSVAPQGKPRGVAGRRGICRQAVAIPSVAEEMVPGLRSVRGNGQGRFTRCLWIFLKWPRGRGRRPGIGPSWRRGRRRVRILRSRQMNQTAGWSQPRPGQGLGRRGSGTLSRARRRIAGTALDSHPFSSAGRTAWMGRPPAALRGGNIHHPVARIRRAFGEVNFRPGRD